MWIDLIEKMTFESSLGRGVGGNHEDIWNAEHSRTKKHVRHERKRGAKDDFNSILKKCVQ